MNVIITPLACVLMALASTSFLNAQPQDPPAQSKGFSEKEVQKLGELLAEVKAQPDYARTPAIRRKKEKAEKEFAEGLEEAKKAHEKEDITSFVDGWAGVFGHALALGLPRNPTGKGRVDTRDVTVKLEGKPLEFEYAIYLPSRYSNNERWPLIIALHDAGSNGTDYLKEVWTDPKRISKDIYDQFVIIAPTIGERTKARSKRDMERIEPFSRLHTLSVAFPMRDVLQNFSIDPDRMYIEGLGLGGETAALIGTMQSKLFAGIAVRGAKPASRGGFSRIDFLQNLKNQCGLMIVDRKGGVAANDAPAIEELSKQHGLPITVRMYDPLPDDKSLRLAQGRLNMDPIHDATEEIAKSFLESRRNLYAKELTYITFNNSSFNQSCWFKMDRANANPDVGTIASIHASIDSEQNSVNFKTVEVDSFRVYFNDKLFDLDRPVKILVNGKELLEKKIERSLDYLLNYHVVNTTDPALVMVGELRVDVPPPEPEPKEDKEGEEGEKGKEGEKDAKDAKVEKEEK